MKIGIILGSTREGRVGQPIADWVLAQAQSRQGSADYELIDLKAFDLPFFTGAVAPRALEKKYQDPKVKAWSEKIDSLDGFVFVTAEYNRSLPAPFKNAFDTLASEWQQKPLAFVGYGYGSSGRDAVAAWRQVVTVMQMPAVDTQLAINLRSELLEGNFVPAQGQDANLGLILEELEKLVLENKEN